MNNPINYEVYLQTKGEEENMDNPIFFEDDDDAAEFVKILMRNHVRFTLNYEDEELLVEMLEELEKTEGGEEQ